VTEGRRGGKGLRIALAGLLACGGAGAARMAYGNDFKPVPPVSALRGDALHEGSRAAVACAADWLLARAAAGEHGWIVEPAGQGHTRKAYTVRYTRKTVEEPVYEWDYEDVWVARHSRESEVDTSERELVKRRRRKPGTRRQVGVRRVEREVADPEGEIVRHVAGAQVAERWQYGFPGQNALALFALREAGVPETHAAVQKLGAALRDHVEKFGCPDATWDVAWLLAAFSRMDDPSYDEARAWLTHKLLDAQIVDPPARGLWGPVSVNVKLLSAMIRAERQIDAELAKRRAVADERPRSRSLRENVERLEAGRRAFTAHYARISQYGLRFEKIRERWNMTSQHDTRRITVPGLPFDLYRETVADLESTFLALFALREAHRRAPLPKTTWRPSVSGKPLIAPESSSAILARAAAALARCQRQDGSWLEENTYQAVDSFQPLAFDPPSRDQWLDLSSAQSPMAQGAALQALRCLADMAGAARVLGRYRAVVQRGRQAALALNERWLDGDGALPNADSPYPFLLTMLDVERPFEGPVQDRPDVRLRLTYRLLFAQNADGSWSQGARAGYSTGLMAYSEERARREHETAQAALPAADRTPFDADGWWDEQVGGSENLYRFDAAAVDTALAVLYLAKGLRDPLAGYIVEQPQTPFPVALATTLRAIENETQVAPTCVAVPPRAAAAPLSGLAALFLDARSPLAAPGLRALLQGALRDGGLLIVESPAGFTPDRIESALRELTGERLRAGQAVAVRATQGGPAVWVETTEAAAARAERRLPGQPQNGFTAYFHADDALAALFLPTRFAGGAALALRQRLPADYFTPDYLRFPDARTARETRRTALAVLSGRAPAARTRPPESRSAPAATGVPSPRSQPAEDEVW